MNHEIAVSQRKKIRGHILRMLSLSHPTPTFESTIASDLIQSGFVISPNIAEYTDYLAGKNYITRTEHGERYGIEEMLLKLTPHGVDLLEDTIQDPGVEV